MNRRFEIIFNKLDYSRIRIHKFIKSYTRNKISNWKTMDKNIQENTIHI